jgi:nucleoside-diphosphate-sugar epimerase
LNVFVTGGTGALGRPTIRRLVAAGHRVRGLAHRQDAAVALGRLGAEPVAGDLCEPASLRTALAGSDAVVHLASRIPPFAKLGRLSAWAENDRIRRDGTRNLVEAALDAGVGTLVYESVVLVYADGGERWIDAASGRLEPGPHARSALDGEEAVARFAGAGGRGVSLRLGLLYSPGDEQTRALVGLTRWGISPVIGPAEAYWPALWGDDAARAVVDGTLRAPSGVYDVVDDRPLTRRGLKRAIAEATGRRLWSPPAVVQRLTLGALSETMSRSLRVRNGRFAGATGWRPEVPDAGVGWRLVVAGAR